MTAHLPLVLGSASPRRREILSSLGLRYRVVPGDADEARAKGESPHRYLERVVLAKLSSVASRVGAGEARAILVADTIVVVDGDILGKPVDAADARQLLGRIVGRAHIVYTRYAVSVAPELASPRVTRTVESAVTMRDASKDEIDRYVETGEGLDKAGAYAAQGIGTFLIERIDGSFSNVVGLPACELVQDLVASGVIEAFPRAEG
jgi:septum formation protein